MNATEIVEAMDAIVTTAETETRSLSDEEVTKYEGLEADLLTARKSDEIAKRNAVYRTPVAMPAVVKAVNEGDAALERAFDSYLRTGAKNADLVELRAQGVGTDSAGGFMAPDGFRQKMTERRRAFGGLSEVVETITTSDGRPLPWPTNDDTANEGELVAEGATGAAGDDLVFGQKSLGAYKYMSLGAGNLPLRVSVELLQDAAFDVQGLLARKLAKRIAKAEAKHWVSGTGTGQPLGIATGAMDIQLATGNAVTYAKLLDIVHAVDPDYRSNARWAFSDGTMKVVRSILDGNNRPLFDDANAAPSANSVGSLLGYPVTVDQGFPQAISNNVIFAVFGDLEAAYVIRRVRDFVLVVDPYGRAANGEVQFTAWERADATIQDSDAYATAAGAAA